MSEGLKNVIVGARIWKENFRFKILKDFSEFQKIYPANRKAQRTKMLKIRRFSLAYRKFQCENFAHAISITTCIEVSAQVCNSKFRFCCWKKYISALQFVTLSVYWWIEFTSKTSTFLGDFMSFVSRTHTQRITYFPENI